MILSESLLQRSRVHTIQPPNKINGILGWIEQTSARIIPPVRFADKVNQPPTKALPNTSPVREGRLQAGQTGNQMPKAVECSQAKTKPLFVLFRRTENHPFDNSLTIVLKL